MTTTAGIRMIVALYSFIIKLGVCGLILRKLTGTLFAITLLLIGLEPFVGLLVVFGAQFLPREFEIPGASIETVSAFLLIVMLNSTFLIEPAVRALSRSKRFVLIVLCAFSLPIGIRLGLYTIGRFF